MFQIPLPWVGGTEIAENNLSMTSISSLLNTNSISQPQATALTPNAAPSNSGSGVSFGDVLDAINPLQHIPVLSNLYRAATGSQISSGSQIAGDTIYGAVFGVVSAATSFVGSVADVATKSATGESIGQHVVATLGAAGSSGTTSGTVTPLVAITTPVPAITTPQPLGDTSTFEGQMANAGRVLSHTGTTQSNAQYQRVQALDSINKHLLHITG
jgi:hypothetical protein